MSSFSLLIFLSAVNLVNCSLRTFPTKGTNNLFITYFARRALEWKIWPVSFSNTCYQKLCTVRKIIRKAIISAIKEGKSSQFWSKSDQCIGNWKERRENETRLKKKYSVRDCTLSPTTITCGIRHRATMLKSTEHKRFRHWNCLDNGFKAKWANLTFLFLWCWVLKCTKVLTARAGRIFSLIQQVR